MIHDAGLAIANAPAGYPMGGRRSQLGECILVNRKAWGDDDTAQLRALVAAGKSDAEVGKEMGRHPEVIGSKRRDLGLKPDRSLKLNAMMARINMRRRLARESRG